MSLRINQDAPNFTADAVIGTGDFTTVDLKKNCADGKWTVLYFYPFDWTGVCKSEIADFDEINGKFTAANTQLVAMSCDSKFSHKEWLQSGKVIESKKSNHPIAADFTKNIARDYGVLDEGMGASMRGTFIIDPKGKLRWFAVNPPLVGRSTAEVYRTLMGLQSLDAGGGPCMVNWQPK